MTDDVNDVEQILSEVNSTESEIPMSAPEQQAEPEYEYTARGKTIKEPISAILKRASQGYDYSQVMQDFNQKQSEFNEKYKLYNEIDQYANQNPDWWTHIQSQYQNRNGQPQQAASPTGELPPELQPILGEINELKQFKQELMAEKNRQFREQEDNRLKEEIEGVKKSYSNLDFSTPGEDGKTLEIKVMEYGVANGIKSFKTAFRDFYHDELLRRAKEEGMESTKKELQKKTRLGLLGETSTPTKGIKDAGDVKNRSYNDLTREALEELGISNTSIRS